MAASQKFISKALSTLAIIVAEFGDSHSATVAVFGDSRRIRREFGDSQHSPDRTGLNKRKRDRSRIRTYVDKDIAAERNRVLCLVQQTLPRVSCRPHTV